MPQINRLSKKQSTIETSVFGAEFVAKKVSVVMLHAIQYKLRMMGISISWPTYIYGDDMLIKHNISNPESTFKNKCNVIAYHAICESVAMRESLAGHIRSEDNPANLLTKVVIEQTRKHLMPLVLYNICDEDA